MRNKTLKKSNKSKDNNKSRGKSKAGKPKPSKSSRPSMSKTEAAGLLSENISLSGKNQVLLRLNKRLYPEYNVLGAVNDFSDNFNVLLDADDDYYLVMIKPKATVLSKKELIALGLEFFNYVMNLGNKGMLE